MRIDVKKFLFVGPEDERTHFFNEAQQAGLIDFIDTRPQKVVTELPSEVQHVSKAIKVLRHFPLADQEENFRLVNADEVVDTIVRLNEDKEALLEEQRVLVVEMARIEVFGDFSSDDIEFIEKEGHCKVQFFCARPGIFQNTPQPDTLIYIDSEHNLDYYVSIAPHTMAYENLMEIKIEQPYGVLKSREAEIRNKLRDIDHELKDYAKYSRLLHHLLLEKLNKYHLYTAEAYVQETMGGSLFAVEGWVPVNKIDQVYELLGNSLVFAEEIAIEPKDAIPTYLENEGFHHLGEDLINIYDTPSSTDKDPSMWVLGSFILFFAFIIGDAGYGLLYLALALFLRYKFPDLKGVGKRVLDIFTLLSIGCIVWGIITTSFFGIEVAPNNPIRKVSFVHWLVEKKAAYHYAHKDATYQEWVKKYPELANVKDPTQLVAYEHEHKHPIMVRLTDNIFFELAIFIGVIHVIFSLARYMQRNWHAAGWIAFLIGAYLYFPFYLKTPSLLNYVGGVDLVKGGEFGLHLMIGGIIIACVLAIFRHGVTGIFELATVIQLFADILSYLRLYALGLAGAIVSATINDIAGAAPLIVGILLILLAHFVNIILCTMSGVIHGLRLNFIEWYHYSFEGGGKEFRPLKLLKME